VQDEVYRRNRLSRAEPPMNTEAVEGLLPADEPIGRKPKRDK
jgi:hypothetical protein